MAPSASSLSDALAKLLTEQRNPRSMGLDRLNTEGILRLINVEDKLVPLAVEREITYIAQAVELIVESLKKGGAAPLFRCGNERSARCRGCIGMSPRRSVRIPIRW